jgi:Mg2+ and Co2+ transporter CorA
VIGICAAVAGVFGMNFDAAFYANGDTGFYATVAVLIVIIAGTSVWARRRGWM